MKLQGFAGSHIRPARPPEAKLRRTTTRRSAHYKTYGITTWSFSRVFECGASWTAAALYLPPKAELFGWA
jgi:hypothetical protein